MSILIKGMKQIPKDCVDCFCFDDYAWQCIVSAHEETVHVGKPNWCPLVPVPTPHGDLIDKDALLESIGNPYQSMMIAYCIEDHAPTVIPAEPPKEE